MFIHHSHADMSATLWQAIRQMRENNDHILTFEKGCYHFYPDYAFEQVSCISNHDNDGFKKTGIPLLDFDGLTVDGNGSDFIFHGIILPMEIGNCQNTVLRNFSIDCAVPQYAHATVLESRENFLRIRIWDNAPFRVENRRLQFTLDGQAYWDTNFFLDIDTDTDMVTEGTYRIPCTDADAEVDPLNPQVVTLQTDLIHIPALGNTLCFHFGYRWTSGIFLHNSNQITIEDVTIHSSLGMGILVQFCRDITVDHLSITPSKGRYMSAPADGIQFVNCSGDLLLQNSLLEKHFDDCLNCHGIYMQIRQILDPHTVLAQLVHNQQLGLTLFHPGEHVELIDHNSLLSYGNNEVIAFESISRSLAIVRFKEELPKSVQIFDCIESTDACPNLTVKNCTFQKAFPRGLLITTRGKVLVEDNYFRTTASAIHISGDCNSWFESGCVRDVTIQNNTFYRCGIAKASGRTANYNVINIVPEIHQCTFTGYFHHNIRITGNRFITAHSNVIKAISTKNLLFRDNCFDIANPIATIQDCDGDIQLS